MHHFLGTDLCYNFNKICLCLFREEGKKGNLYWDRSYFFYKTVFQVPPTKKWEDKRFAHAQDKTTKCAQSGRAQLKAAAITENYGGSCIPGLHSTHSLFLLPHGSSSTRHRHGLQHSSFSELTSRSVQDVCSFPPWLNHVSSWHLLVIEFFNSFDQDFEECMSSEISDHHVKAFDEKILNMKGSTSSLQEDRKSCEGF